MKFLSLAIALLVFAGANAGVGNPEDVLFTVDGEPVYVGEFERVYTKNNINNQADYSKASLDEYLDLYVKFKLKVTEAETLGYDTIPALMSELAGYRRQLAKSYLSDKEITDKLIREAYDRSLKEIHVSHILKRVTEDALPSDTLKAYKDLRRLRRSIISGQDFADVAKRASEDPSAKENFGDIGYITAFQTVYPFENALYTTKVGEVSKPFRTQFGYHIIQVHDIREARGEIKVAHILFKHPDEASVKSVEDPESKAKKVHADLVAGTKEFASAVKEYSDDRYTKTNGGELPWFGTGRMVSAFEEAAFALKENGDISEPVETRFGWHIIMRLDKKEAPAFEDVKSEYKTKVEKDARSNVAKDVLISRIKKEYNFQEYREAKDHFIEQIDESVLTERRWRSMEREKFDRDMFIIGDKVVTQANFLLYIENRHKPSRSGQDITSYINEYYKQFREQQLVSYEESQLDNKYPDFKNLMKEYRDGILLFDLTDKMVWSKAVKDSAGLYDFHQANRNDYMWKERMEYAVITADNEKAMKKAKKYAQKGWSASQIADKLNKKSTVISYEMNTMERGADEEVDAWNWKKGVQSYSKTIEGKSRFVLVENIIAPTPKELHEARGYIVSDYQEHLEKEWLADLRDKYEVNINQEVFEGLIKE